MGSLPDDEDVRWRLPHLDGRSWVWLRCAGREVVRSEVGHVRSSSLWVLAQAQSAVSGWRRRSASYWSVSDSVLRGTPGQRFQGLSSLVADNYDPGRVEAQGNPRMPAGARKGWCRRQMSRRSGQGMGYRQRRGRPIGWCSATGRTMAISPRGVAVAGRGATLRGDAGSLGAGVTEAGEPSSQSGERDGRR